MKERKLDDEKRKLISELTLAKLIYDGKYINFEEYTKLIKLIKEKY